MNTPKRSPPTEKWEIPWGWVIIGSIVTIGLLVLLGLYLHSKYSDGSGSANGTDNETGNNTPPPNNNPPAQDFVNVTATWGTPLVATGQVQIPNSTGTQTVVNLWPIQSSTVNAGNPAIDDYSILLPAGSYAVTSIGGANCSQFGAPPARVDHLTISLVDLLSGTAIVPLVSDPPTFDDSGVGYLYTAPNTTFKLTAPTTVAALPTQPDRGRLTGSCNENLNNAISLSIQQVA